MPDSLDTGWTPRPALRACLASLAVLLAPVAPAAATPELRGGGQFRRPVQVAAPPGDQRLFVVEQAGRVRVLGAHGTLAAKPFLDLSAQTIIGDERGLVGLAFAADYATSGEFFVFLTVKQPEGQVQVRRYRVSTADPNRADPASGVTILRQDHARPTHNGGGLRVGPDGKLWASLGDGSISNDDLDNGQNRQTLPGKLLRLERDGSPAAGNPFLGATDGTRPEIWQYGLRNAFRFSFDRATGDLVLGDVGESAREEIDLAPAAENRLPGANWGWPCFEGLRPNRPCSAPGAVAPVIDFDHARDGVRAIAGGVVVRDPGLPTLAGRYLYGDLGYDRLHSVALAKRADRPERSLRLPVVVSV
ncbi:MAG: hypothetical protein QOI80_1561, partial [Solirubrobacteraceae bacterium]|nr:hypothetical protein [Solirubrobacteraceae bacterium]